MTADALLYKLYGCQGDPARWTDMLNQLCRETGARSAVLQTMRRRGEGLSVAWSAADARTQAQQHAPAPGVADDGNPRLGGQRIARGLGRIVRDRDLFDDGDPAQRRLQELLAQRRLGCFIGSLQQLDDGMYLGLALHRDVDDAGDFTPSGEALLAQLAPHLCQAVGLQLRAQARAELDRRLRGHLDQLRGALLICGADGRVQWLNQGAQDVLRAGGPLQLRDGMLGAAGVAADMLLKQALAAALDGAGGTRCLVLGQGMRRLQLALQAPGGSGDAGHPASVLVAITGVAAGAPPPAAAIAALFGLTPAEASLVAGLAAGSTLEQYAAQRGVSLGTVRGQLKQAQAKTGASRQAELVRMVLSCAAAQFL